jgi:NADPH-dependent glutamate synthase beta subunit-like oxidoreductase
VPGASGPEVTGSQTYVIDQSAMTTRRGVFAGGDAVRGPDLIVTALHDGRRADAAIDGYLNGLD